MDQNVPHYLSVLFIILKFTLCIFFVQGLREALSKTDYSKRKQKTITLSAFIGIFSCLLILGVLAHKDFFLDFSAKPPALFLVVIPVILLVLIFIFSGLLDKILLHAKPWWLIGLQTFRVFVEIILWVLFSKNIIPVQMTFEGYNFDILVGLTAIPIAYFCYRKEKVHYLPIVIWNVLGIIILLNIVVISVISTPSPLRVFMNEPANTVIAYYPFIWLPGLMVPMALFLHLASLRQIKLKRGSIF